jgi:hypothetical protein
LARLAGAMALNTAKSRLYVSSDAVRRLGIDAFLNTEMARGCWIVVGLAMVALGATIVWWANFSMESHDMEAPAMVACMAAIIFIPLSVGCFTIAAFASKKPPEASQELPEVMKVFRLRDWSDGEDD